MAKKKTCETCGTKSTAVKTMPDPMTTALEPEATDHDEMTLCPPCAIARYEES